MDVYSTILAKFVYRVVWQVFYPGLSPAIPCVVLRRWHTNVVDPSGHRVSSNPKLIQIKPKGGRKLLPPVHWSLKRKFYRRDDPVIILANFGDAHKRSGKWQTAVTMWQQFGKYSNVIHSLFIY